MTTITPCLWFDGNGLEAAEHYVSVLPDSRITDVSYYGPEQPGEKGKVMTVAFELAGRRSPRSTAARSTSSPRPSRCRSPPPTRRRSTGTPSELTAGGGEVGPCGWLKDRFGLSWQVVPVVAS